MADYGDFGDYGYAPPSYTDVGYPTNHPFNDSLRNAGDPEWLELNNSTQIKLVKKVLIPVFRHPRFNVVGKLIGPKGLTLKNIAKTYKCHVYVLGRGSSRDMSKEQQLLASGDPKFSHYNHPLHVKIEVTALPALAYQRIGSVLEVIGELMKPVKDTYIEGITPMSEQMKNDGESEEGKKEPMDNETMDEVNKTIAEAGNNEPTQDGNKPLVEDIKKEVIEGGNKEPIDGENEGLIEENTNGSAEDEHKNYMDEINKTPFEESNNGHIEQGYKKSIEESKPSFGGDDGPDVSTTQPQMNNYRSAPRRTGGRRGGFRGGRGRGARGSSDGSHRGGSMPINRGGGPLRRGGDVTGNGGYSGHFSFSDVGGSRFQPY